MKKSLIYFSALLAFGLASCDDTSDLGVMQTNPQETVMVKDGVQVALVAPVTGNALDIASQPEIIPVISYTADATLPENATLDFVMELAKDGSYAGAIEIPMDKVEGADNTYGVKSSYWDDAFRHLLGKAPFAKENYIRVAAYVCVGEQRSRIGGADGWYAEKSLSVTPVDLNIQVEEAYYLVGSLNDWQIPTAIKFSHSDLSPFDDPVFTLAIDVPAELETAGCWWKIVPESAYQANSWDGLFGTATDGDTSLEGLLVENGQAGCLKIAGQYLFTINMLDGSYKVSQAIPMLYTPGNGNGWNFETGMLDTWNYADYFGFTHMNGGFKVTDRPAWGGMEWGAGEEPGTLKLGGGDIQGPENGLYWMTVNIGSLTYDFLKVETIGMIGGFSDDNNWASDYAELTPGQDLLVWTADVNFTDANTTWKFRVNGDWAVNFGEGEEGVLSLDGANLSAPGVGTYTITLDLRTVPYSYTAVKK
ncbi:MAG: hypothetical protein K2L45_08760 [Muribaculaceae bacterium]|nr:hypothetical protein [Muribaculaceae bacterium]